MSQELQRNGLPNARHADSVTVATLLCHAHVPMAIDCLGSWSRFWKPQPIFVIQDDGSLTEMDKDLLMSSLPVVRIVGRDEARHHLHENHRNLGTALCLWEENILLAKVMSCAAMCDHEVFRFVDSDILLWRSVADPFESSSIETEAVFMSDRESSYSMRSLNKLLAWRVNLTSRQNSGVILLKRDLLDLDLLEWFLKRPFRRGPISPMYEQTYWALLASRIKANVFDPQQFRIMRDEPDGSELIGGHFTAKTRHLLPKYVERAKSSDPAESPVQLRLVDPGRCTALDLFGYEIRRVAKKIGRR